MAGINLATAFAALLWLAASTPAMADAAALIVEVVAAHGGGATPAAIHERGVTQSTRRGSGPVERWWQAPDRFRIEIRYAGAEESRILSGTEAWQQGRPATAPFHGALVLQAARMALPWRLQEHARQVIDHGTAPGSDGKPVRLLEWPVRDGIRLLVEIDPATRRISRSRGILTVNGSSMEFATRYEDYKPFDGRLVATTEQHYAMGQFIGTTRLETIEFPATLPEQNFLPALPRTLTLR